MYADERRLTMKADTTGATHSDEAMAAAITAVVIGTSHPIRCARSADLARHDAPGVPLRSQPTTERMGM